MRSILGISVRSIWMRKKYAAFILICLILSMALIVVISGFWQAFVGRTKSDILQSYIKHHPDATQSQIEQAV